MHGRVDQDSGDPGGRHGVIGRARGRGHHTGSRPLAEGASAHPWIGQGTEGVSRCTRRLERCCAPLSRVPRWAESAPTDAAESTLFLRVPGRHRRPTGASRGRVERRRVGGAPTAAGTRGSGASRGAVPVDPPYRTAGRGRDWLVQDRGNPASGAMTQPRGCQVRDTGMGRPVQSPAPWLLRIALARRSLRLRTAPLSLRLARASQTRLPLHAD